ncbi:glycoside hydrolase family 15 protein [Nocardioides iriomotensis]|uniref:glycoside hydrolase family 15 protein n=1 Tax=Nocardioides iriomotensis TaxID=715784 RepID=UPI001F0EB525|nr:glycoside hydrolase family 15 protein [Nocardioides iriomotensis]
MARSQAAGASPFPPIAEYAFLSDCETSCLIAPGGEVEWMCVPRHDSPSVFATMLDRGAGCFRVAPYGVREPTSRRYLPGSLILETTWQTETGWMIVRDALVMGPWHHVDERAARYRRVPTDYEAEHCLLRTIRCVSGSVELSVLCEPVFDYGRGRAGWEYDGAGYGEARATSVDDAAGTTLRLTTDRRLGIEGSAAHVRSRMVEGEQAFVALSWAAMTPARTWAEAMQKQWQTTEFWRQWISIGSFPDHPWREQLQRSALTLKGLTYAPTGALIAAATTSLPEAPGGQRNWDYRFAWIRDSTFALWALYTLGLDREANDFFAFIRDVAAEDDLQLMYGIGGERELTETVVAELDGYDGAKPVRIGNAAVHQRQHDMWGAMLDSVYLHVKSRDQLPETLWPILLRQVEQAAAHWREPDRGIWEVRGEPQHFTSSKLMCWVALDRGAKLAQLHGEAEYAMKWQAIAAEIHDDICANGVDDRGVFVQRYGATALDASLLLVPLVRFLPAADPRVRATVLAIADELTTNGLVLRYRVEETNDGLPDEEGAFTICSFWLVSALVEIGEVGRASALCERLLAYASPLGLYGEEIDPTSGRHLGNFPQAFTHLALINALMHLIRARERQVAGQFTPAHRTGR